MLRIANSAFYGLKVPVSTLSHALMVEGDFAAARLEAELAVALDPNNADAHQCLAHILVCLELPEEALSSARRAIKASAMATR